MNTILIIMVDTARQLLDELMGRNRNLDPASAQSHKINWDDPEVSDNNTTNKHKTISLIEQKTNDAFR